LCVGACSPAAPTAAPTSGIASPAAAWPLPFIPVSVSNGQGSPVPVGPIDPGLAAFCAELYAQQWVAERQPVNPLMQAVADCETLATGPAPTPTIDPSVVALCGAIVAQDYAAYYAVQHDDMTWQLVNEDLKSCEGNVHP
jgi:hypothetical protein